VSDLNIHPRSVRRTFWRVDDLSQDSCAPAPYNEDRRMVPEDEANLVSSWLVNGEHSPALDIDLPCVLVPSSTPGKFHLYIDKPMPWETYKTLLRALADAGILEQEYASASIAKGQSFLRKPGVTK